MIMNSLSINMNWFSDESWGKFGSVSNSILTSFTLLVSSKYIDTFRVQLKRRLFIASLAVTHLRLSTILPTVFQTLRLSIWKSNIANLQDDEIQYYQLLLGFCILFIQSTQLSLFKCLFMNSVYRRWKLGVVVVEFCRIQLRFTMNRKRREASALMKILFINGIGYLLR